jgi:hypothetical protein
LTTINSSYGQYATVLLDSGFDSAETVAAITKQYLQDMKLKPGHANLIWQAAQKLGKKRKNEGKELFNVTHWLTTINSTYRQYATVLLDSGFDSAETVAAITKQNLQDMKLKPGHANLIWQAAQKLGKKRKNEGKEPVSKKRKKDPERKDDGGGEDEEQKKPKRGRRSSEAPVSTERTIPADEEEAVEEEADDFLPEPTEDADEDEPDKEEDDVEDDKEGEQGGGGGEEEEQKEPKKKASKISLDVLRRREPRNSKKETSERNDERNIGGIG